MKDIYFHKVDREIETKVDLGLDLTGEDSYSVKFEDLIAVGNVNLKADAPVALEVPGSGLTGSLTVNTEKKGQNSIVVGGTIDGFTIDTNVVTNATAAGNVNLTFKNGIIGGIISKEGDVIVSVIDTLYAGESGDKSKIKGQSVILAGKKAEGEKEGKAIIGSAAKPIVIETAQNGVVSLLGDADTEVYLKTVNASLFNCNIIGAKGRIYLDDTTLRLLLGGYLTEIKVPPEVYDFTVEDEGHYVFGQWVDVSFAKYEDEKAIREYGLGYNEEDQLKAKFRYGGIVLFTEKDAEEAYEAEAEEPDGEMGDEESYDEIKIGFLTNDNVLNISSTVSHAALTGYVYAQESGTIEIVPAKGNIGTETNPLKVRSSENGTIAINNVKKVYLDLTGSEKNQKNNIQCVKSRSDLLYLLVDQQTNFLTNAEISGKNIVIVNGEAAGEVILGDETNSLNLKAKNTLRFCSTPGKLTVYLDQVNNSESNAKGSEVQIDGHVILHVTETALRGMDKIIPVDAQANLELYVDKGNFVNRYGEGFSLGGFKNLKVIADKGIIDITGSTENVEISMNKVLDGNVWIGAENVVLNVKETVNKGYLIGNGTATINAAFKNLEVNGYRKVVLNRNVDDTLTLVSRNGNQMTADFGGKIKRAVLKGDSTGTEKSGSLVLNLYGANSDISLTKDGCELEVNNRTGKYLHGSIIVNESLEKHVTRINSDPGIGRRGTWNNEVLYIYLPIDEVQEYHFEIRSKGVVFLNQRNEGKFCIDYLEAGDDVDIYCMNLTIGHLFAEGHDVDIFINADSHLRAMKGFISGKYAIHCKNLSLSERQTYGSKIQVYVDKIRRGDWRFINMKSSQAEEEKQELNMQVETQMSTERKNTSASILSLGTINDVAFRFEGIVNELEKDGNIFERYYELSDEKTQYYLKKEFRKIEKDIKSLEKIYGLKSYSISNKQARSNYLALRDNDGDYLRYNRNIFKLACIKILMDDYEHAFKLLETCLNMNCKIDVSNFMMGILSLYLDKPATAQYYFNEYLTHAPEYDKKIARTIRNNTYDPNDLYAEYQDGKAPTWGTADAKDLEDSKMWDEALSLIYSDSLAERISLIIACCQYDGYTEVAGTYLTLAQKLGIDYDETLYAIIAEME